ncbi:hypothetical protein ACVWWR_002959 [Bradyrhizobium sp. LM3.2]
MQPLRRGAHPEPGLIQMLDRCPADLLADCRSEILRPAGSPGDHLSDRAGRDGHAKQIGEDLPEPIFRQKLSRRQIGHHSGQPDAILRWRPYLGWKRSCRDRATAAAFATIELMLRDEQRRRRRQIEHLTAADKFQQFTLQRHSAAPASDRAMHDRMIDPFGPLQVFACMAGLAAGLLQPSLTQALCPARSLARSIARRRLAAIGAIQTKPTLQIGHTHRQQCVLLLQHQVALLQLPNQGQQGVHRQ